MDIVCKACGQTSRDPEFCDHCNGDLNGRPVAPPVPNLCPIFPWPDVEGRPDAGLAGVPLTPEQQALLSHPEASLLMNVDGRYQRVHWIDHEALPLWTARLRERLAKGCLRCLPPARLAEQAAGAWMLVGAAESASPLEGMSPGEFQPWASALEDPLEECERLLRFFTLLTNAVEELHAHGLVWLTFDPRHLEQSSPTQLRFTNLDMSVYPAGQCPERLQLRASFAAPEIVRYQVEDIGPRTDVFHLALFAYYWLAGLLPDGFPGEGLEAIWYQLPKLRIYAPRLPPGIAGVLARGMALDPSHRHATPRALAAALEAALERNRVRRRYQGQVRWQIGAETRTGRTKTALGKDNEDRVLVLGFDSPRRALLAVADGITTCAVGSGALASLIVTIVLENTFDAASTRETFEARIAQACGQSAHTLLAWALEKGYLEQLKDGADLMGTTLTAGWLEGNVLSLANLGDSRAYLVAEVRDRESGVSSQGSGVRGQESGVSSQESRVRSQESALSDQESAVRDQVSGAGLLPPVSCPLTPGVVVEQLTVDGDLASGMLAEGVPPETIHDIGPVAKALRQCIGGCTVDAAGEVNILEECCDPTVMQWPLVPGDVLVLCSDGLIEEGAFMEPEMLGEIIRANRHLSAQELAWHLAMTADNLHRLPSPLEPEGFGDNISCIVVKIEEA